MNRSAEDYYKDNDLAIDVLKRSYLAPGETGPGDMWERISKAIASVEEDKDYWEAEFYNLLEDFKFVPGGRIMHGAGREDAKRRPTLSNCYVIPIEEDSLEGIYRCISESALVYRTGGGVGTDLSVLRPKGSRVNATVDTSPGATSFMNLFSESTNTVSQAGRRGALMLTLRVDHPDIEDFIVIKNDKNRSLVKHANVSVLITHEFMKAVEKDEDFDLCWGGKVYRTVRAKDLWDKIIENAHASAEPGIIFWDTMKDYHNVEYTSPLSSTNPCVTGDTLVPTTEGTMTIKELCDTHSEIYSPLIPEGVSSIAPAFSSGIKDVFNLYTKEGYSLRLTEDHKIMTERGWVKAKNIKEDDKIKIWNGNGGFGKEGIVEEGRVLGWLIGDGTINEDKGAILSFWGNEKELAPCFAKYVYNMVKGTERSNRDYKIGVVNADKVDSCRVSSVRLKRLIEERFDVTKKNKIEKVPDYVFRSSKEFQKGFLQGLFSADGYVSGNPNKGTYIRLTSISKSLLEGVQKLLVNFGIFSVIYYNRRNEREVTIKEKTYRSKAYHELHIGKNNVRTFKKNVDFIVKEKQDKIDKLLSDYVRRGQYSEKFYARFKSLEFHGKEEVYDLMEPVSNSFVANGIVVHNCGELPLPDYEACNLGSLNLSKFVKDGKINIFALAVATDRAVHFLDNVITYNHDNHALDKSKKAVEGNRRIGLGITGLADALVKMGVKYDSEEALKEVDGIMETIRYHAYATSISIGEKKGAFPLFDWDGYRQSKYARNLPSELKDKIKHVGIRNSTVLTVPPVGTGSIVAESSSGIEPIFCTSYQRRVKQEDGHSFSEYTVYHPLVKEMFGTDEKLPEYVVTAHEIDPYFRVKLQGVIQKYVDSSISSTINLPNDVSVGTVSDIYLNAYKEGLKGVTVYREGCREGILTTEGFGGKEKGEHHPRTRPAVTKGVTERIRTGEGNIFITINEDEEGICEVFSTIGKAGGNVAAQSEAISRLISMALRSGVDPWEIVHQLNGISGQSPVWDNGDLILSTPDAIGKALTRYLNQKEGKKNTQFTGNGVICPECSMEAVNEGSCVSCKHCGWSKCS